MYFVLWVYRYIYIYLKWFWYRETLLALYGRIFDISSNESVTRIDRCPVQHSEGLDAFRFFFTTVAAPAIIVFKEDGT